MCLYDAYYCDFPINLPKSQVFDLNNNYSMVAQ